MIETAPTSVDTLDFQFKLHCRLKVFQEKDTSHFDTACNLLAIASRYDLLFVGSNNPYFQVIQIHNIQRYSLKDGDVDNYIRRTISLPSNPQHLSVNCDCTKLSVIVKENDCSKAIVYDVTSFMRQDISIIKEIRLSPTPNVNVLEAVWNPAIPTLFTVCKNDGSLAVYDLKESGIEINELQKSVGATCMCWSPKGKQLAVGSQDGKIIQYKPDLKITREIDGPPFQETQFPIALQWISNYQFIAIYRTKDADGQSNLIVVNCPKGGAIAYINYEDICYSYGNSRPPQFYMLLQNSWNILLVASANSMEVGVLGFEKDVWTQWVLADAARAELPLSATKQDTLPIGLCLDTSTTQPLPWGEGTVPPPPLLLLLSHHGVLCCFYAVNLKYNGSICQPPEALTNSAANTFTASSDHMETLPNKPIAINPTKTNILVSMPQPSTTFSFTFNQGPKAMATSSNNSVPPIAQSFFSGTPISKSDTQLAFTQPSFTFNTKSTLAKNIQPVPKTEVQSQQINLLDKGQVSKQASDPRLVDEKSVNMNTKILEKLEEQTEIDRNETELLIAQMVKEECAMLESEFKAFVKHKQGVKIDLGTETEATNLVQSTNQLQDFVEEISEICQAQSTEIHFLKQNLIQNWAWYEEARSRFASDKDPSLVALARAQPLDAASARQLEEIRHLLYYLQSQLTQANAALDEQWEAFQDSCKKRMSLKLPSIEAIYQSMVKQCATVQKQIYILKDISNRIKNTAHMRTIPHLLVSLDNVDVLEEQLKHLQLHTKDVLQMRFKGVFEKQRQLTSSKSKNLSQLLKTRRFNRVCASKLQLPNNASMQSNGFSPIINKKELQPQRLNFVQSTPKIAVQKKNNIELKKALEPVVNLFEDNCVKPGNKELAIPQVKNVIANNNTKSSNIFTEISNSSTVGFSDFKTLATSAFASTSQATIGIKSSTNINTNNISIDKSKNVVPFNIPTSPTTSMTVSVQSPPISVTSTTNSAPNNQKPLFSSKFNNVSVPTTQFGFGTTTSTPTFGVSTSALDVAQKPTFSFSNLTSANYEKTTSSTSSLINKTSSSTVPFSGYFTFSPNIVSLGNNDVTSSTKSIFSSIAVTSTTSKASQDVLTTSAAINAPSVSITPFTKPFGFSQANNSGTSGTIFSSLATITPITTCATTTTNVAATIAATNVPATVAPFVTVSKTSANLFASTGNQIFTMPSITLSSTPTKNESSTAVASMSTTLPPLFSISTASNQSLDLTAGNRNFTINTISFATTTTNITSSPEHPGSVATSPIKSESGTANLESSTITTAPLASATSFSFRGVSTTSSATLQPSIFQTPPQSTQNMFDTTKSPLASTSMFGSSPQTASIFGSPQKIFGTTSPTVTTPTATTASTLQPIFVANTEITTTSPSLFSTTNVPISKTQSAMFESAKISSSSQTSVFGVPTNSNPIIQSSAFGAPTSNTLFGSQNAPISSGSIFGAASTMSTFPATKSTFAGTFSSSAPTFSTANTSPIFFTPSSSASTAFGQNATFGSGSLFSNPISTNVGSIFGGASNIPTSVFETATTTNDNIQFGSVFGTSSNTNAFGSSNETFRFSSSTATNSNSGGFGFNKPAFTTFGNSASSTDTASLSFGNLGLSTTASSFGSAFNQNPFSRAPAQEQKTPFSGGNLFSTPATTTASNIFGGSSPFNKSAPAFGGPATFGSAPVFGQGSGFGQNTFGANTSVFGSSPSGPFSRNTQTINQTGFGATSPFNSQSTFGSTTPSGFGAPPTFGSPAFGSNSTFNEANKSFADSFGTTSQQSSNFANLANQPTLGFGNLAQQSQTPTSQPAFSPGSSFSNWR